MAVRIHETAGLLVPACENPIGLVQPVAAVTAGSVLGETNRKGEPESHWVLSLKTFSENDQCKGISENVQ